MLTEQIIIILYSCSNKGFFLKICLLKGITVAYIIQHIRALGTHIMVTAFSILAIFAFQWIFCHLHMSSFTALNTTTPDSSHHYCIRLDLKTAGAWYVVLRSTLKSYFARLVLFLVLSSLVQLVTVGSIN